MTIDNSIQIELDLLISRLENNISLYAGYPPNTEFDYSPLFSALGYPINNLGDTFTMSNPFSTHDFEYRVIEWFLNLYGLNVDNGWGYVTSCGSEGIFFGLWLARQSTTKPIVYYSSYSHYSIPKAINLLQLEYRCIKTDLQGQIDYQDFEDKLVHHRDAIIVATLGSTMTSSIDDTYQLRKIAEGKGLKVYIHADAAIDGMILPFINTAFEFKLSEGINSVSISGHKIIGSPIPCGVVLTHKTNIDLIKNYVNYVSNYDTTLFGSRNGFAALILWYAIKKKGRIGFEKLIQEAINRSKLYIDKFTTNNIYAWRYEHAITIVLEKLPKEFLEKWRMPSNEYYSTLTALPKLTTSMIDEFIEDVVTFRTKGYLSSNPNRIIFPNIKNIGMLD